MGIESWCSIGVELIATASVEVAGSGFGWRGFDAASRVATRAAGECRFGVSGCSFLVGWCWCADLDWPVRSNRGSRREMAIDW